MLIVGFTLISMLAILLSAALRQRFGAPVAYTRKAFHFTIFTAAFITQRFLGLPAVILFGTITTLLVLYAVVRGRGFIFFDALARPTDSPEERFFIILPLLTTVLGGLISNLLFPRFALIGYLATGWGDAAGEPIGIRFGKRKYRVPSPFGLHTYRSLEGSAAVFIVGWIAILVGLLIQGTPLALAVWPSLLCSAAVTIVESFTPHGLDNLTLQVVAAGMATLLVR